MSNQPDNNGTPELVLMMGLPASGKGYVGEQLFGNTHTFIDCDTIKEAMVNYDPLNPQTVHEDVRIIQQPTRLSL